MAKETASKERKQGQARASPASLPQVETVVRIPLDQLHPFPNHPFKVRDDDAMQETVESVKTYGVLTPAIVRPLTDGYEIVAGHRRHHACGLAGLNDIPAIVRQMDDDTATILMVDSTGTTPIQRYVLFSAQSSGITQDSPAGREIISIPAVNVDLFCAHVGIPNTYDNIDFSTGDNWMNKNDPYIENEPIMMRIAYVSNDGTKAVVIVCTATVQTQAGVGIFLIEIIPPPPPGTPVSIQKASALPGITNGNGCYSLKGAVYGLYSDAACKKLLEKLTTDASGNATSANQYDPGTTLYLKEISPSPGYLLDPNTYTIQIDESGNVTKK